MKKLIAGICVTMLLASCGNDAEKKASEKLSAARSAFAQGDYNEAKLQIALKFYIRKPSTPEEKASN